MLFRFAAKSFILAARSMEVFEKKYVNKLFDLFRLTIFEKIKLALSEVDFFIFFRFVAKKLILAT